MLMRLDMMIVIFTALLTLCHHGSPAVIDPQEHRNSCAVGRRSTIQDALDELFTCFTEERVKVNNIYKKAEKINYGGIAGNGVTQAPLLKNRFSTKELLSDSNIGYRLFLNLVPAFTVELGKNETRGTTEMTLINVYLRFLETSPFIKETYETLRANGVLQSVNSLSKFVREVMWSQWFELYGRSKKSHENGLRESSGFGHVMVGELKSGSVTGFHSWLQILTEEEAGKFEYKGYFSTIRQPLQLAAIQFGWMNKIKSISSFLFGVPPEFELALFSASFIVNPGRMTRFKISGKELKVQTYSVYHQPQSVATAYVKE